MKETDRYRIEGLLGKGGMGEVHRAFDTILGRYVALKVLRRDERDEQDEQDPSHASDPFRELLREARRCAALQHPNIVTIFDVVRSEDEATAFIAMELIEGRNLRAAAANPSATTASRIGWIRDVASALAAAHAVSLVHRDIKPENVIVKHDGSLKVLDFGIAKWSAPRPIETETGTMTATGPIIAGTPGYMAPEQTLGIIDERSDQFAWGILAYEVLSRRRAPRDRPLLPDEVESAVSPPSLAAVVVRATSPRASDRFPSMKALLEAMPPVNSVVAGAAESSAKHFELATTIRDAGKDDKAIRAEKTRGAPKRNSAAASVGAAKRVTLFVGSALLTSMLVGGGLYAGWRVTRPKHSLPPASSTDTPAASVSASGPDDDAGSIVTENEDSHDASVGTRQQGKPIGTSMASTGGSGATVAPYVYLDAVDPVTEKRRRITITGSGSDVYSSKQVQDACVARMSAIKTCFSVHKADFDAPRWWIEVASHHDRQGALLALSRVSNVGEPLGSCLENVFTRKNLALPLVASTKEPITRTTIHCAIISTIVDPSVAVWASSMPPPQASASPPAPTVSATKSARATGPIKDFPGHVGSVRMATDTSPTFIEKAEYDRYRAVVEPKIPACLNLPRGECTDELGMIIIEGSTSRPVRFASVRREESIRASNGKFYCDYPKPVADCLAKAIASDTIAHHGHFDSRYSLFLIMAP